MSNRFTAEYREEFWARLPPDIALVIGVVLLSSVLLVVRLPGGWAVQFLVGLPLFVFLPGYSVVAALFPERYSARGGNAERESNGAEQRGVALLQRGITPLERFALSLGTSVTVVPLLGLVLNVTLSELTKVSVIFSLALFTVVAAGTAGYRRANLPESDRFRVPFRRWAVAFGRPPDRSTLVANVVLLLAVAALVTSFAYTTTTPNDRFTEFYVLSENDAGELVADGYPQQLNRDESVSLYIGVENRERADITYTVVVQLHEVTEDRTSVISVNQIDRFRLDVAAGDRRVKQHSVTPTIAGEQLRLTYLLYRGDAPQRPQPGSAYRQTHIWVDVSA